MKMEAINKAGKATKVFPVKWDFLLRLIKLVLGGPISYLRKLETHSSKISRWIHNLDLVRGPGTSSAFVPVVEDIVYGAIIRIMPAQGDVFFQYQKVYPGTTSKNIILYNYRETKDSYKMRNVR